MGSSLWFYLVSLYLIMRFLWLLDKSWWQRQLRAAEAASDAPAQQGTTRPLRLPPPPGPRLQGRRQLQQPYSVAALQLLQQSAGAIEVVFRHLGEADRIAAMGVCRAWRECIQQSPALHPLLSLDCPTMDAQAAALIQPNQDFPAAGRQLLLEAPKLPALAVRLESSFGARSVFAAALLAALPAGLTRLCLSFQPTDAMLQQLPRFMSLQLLELGAAAAEGWAGPLNAALLARCAPRSLRQLSLSEAFSYHAPTEPAFFTPLRSMTQLHSLSLAFPATFTGINSRVFGLARLPLTRLELGRGVSPPDAAEASHLHELRQLSVSQDAGPDMLAEIARLPGLTLLHLQSAMPYAWCTEQLTLLSGRLLDFSCTWYACREGPYTLQLPSRWALTRLTSLALCADVIPATPACVVSLASLRRLSLVSRRGELPRLLPGAYLWQLEALECRGAQPGLPLLGTHPPSSPSITFLFTPGLRKLYLYLPATLSEAELALLADGLPRLLQLRVGRRPPAPAWCTALLRCRPDLHLFLEQQC